MRGLTSEIPLTFRCAGDTLVGILHRPSIAPATGVVIVVGGPQYRVGSHRLFVSLARDVSARGAAVLRFDCRGMGDSEGEFPGFENIESDIEAAIGALVGAVPSVSKVGLWALCDGASAVCLYGHKDPRVTGIALLNPWVRTEASHARTFLKHYYWRRIIDPSFLRKVVAGNFDFWNAVRSLFANVGRVVRRKPADTLEESNGQRTLPERMAKGLQKFRGIVLVITAGRDLTAREFDDVTRRSKDWRRLFAADGVRRYELNDADHTFSQREWSDQVFAWTGDWLADITNRTE